MPNSKQSVSPLHLAKQVLLSHPETKQERTTSYSLQKLEKKKRYKCFKKQSAHCSVDFYLIISFDSSQKKAEILNDLNYDQCRSSSGNFPSNSLFYWSLMTFDLKRTLWSFLKHISNEKRKKIFQTAQLNIQCRKQFTVLFCLVTIFLIIRCKLHFSLLSISFQYLPKYSGLRRNIARKSGVEHKVWGQTL